MKNSNTTKMELNYAIMVYNDLTLKLLLLKITISL